MDHHSKLNCHKKNDLSWMKFNDHPAKVPEIHPLETRRPHPSSGGMFVTQLPSRKMEGMRLRFAIVLPRPEANHTLWWM